MLRAGVRLELPAVAGRTVAHDALERGQRRTAVLRAGDGGPICARVGEVHRLGVASDAGGWHAQEPRRELLERCGVQGGPDPWRGSARRPCRPHHGAPLAARVQRGRPAAVGGALQRPAGLDRGRRRERRRRGRRAPTWPGAIPRGGGARTRARRLARRAGRRRPLWRGRGVAPGHRGFAAGGGRPRCRYALPRAEPLWELGGA
mmetsp:Transcript_35127/g.109349  ORF Transcript_35127/g.109349 Transcript_35127/m.109349 type:complete len:204 (-) Transcript_35127:163-774(-)